MNKIINIRSKITNSYSSRVDLNAKYLVVQAKAMKLYNQNILKKLE